MKLTPSISVNEAVWADVLAVGDLPAVLADDPIHPVRFMEGIPALQAVRDVLGAARIALNLRGPQVHEVLNAVYDSFDAHAPIMPES